MALVTVSRKAVESSSLARICVVTGKTQDIDLYDVELTHVATGTHTSLSYPVVP